MNAEAVLWRFQGLRRNGSGWMARCPAHADKNPSLSINEGEGKILLKCFAGCTTEAVCAAAGIELSELFSDNGARPRIIAEYNYPDENGNQLFQVVRLEPKTFRQRRPDGNGGWKWNLDGVRRVIYRLPEALMAKSVLVCEGEKDCEAARALGIVATCNPGGARKWREEHSEYLRGKQITIIADADEPGRKHAQQVAASLAGKAESVKVLEFAHAKDLTEWVERGGTRDALIEQIRNTVEWKPAEEAPVKQAGARSGAVLRCFRDIAPKALRWLWPGRIPLGKLTLLIGDPGLGKSLLTADIASRVTRGTSFPDGATCESGSVILLSAEDDPADTIRPRLDAAGADVSRVHTLEAVRVELTDGSLADKPFNLETDVAALEAALREYPGVRLVVIDPISAYLGGVDSHSNAEVRGVLTPLATLAAQHNLAVLCVTHLRKSAGAVVYRAIASIAFTAAARAVWAVAPDPEEADRRLLLAVKQNLSANIGGLAFRVETQGAAPRLAWESGAVALAANDVLGDEVQQDQSERREAKEWLEDLLADGPVAVKKIRQEATAAGLSWMTVRRAKDALGVVAYKSGYQGKWEWRLDDSQSKDAHAVDTQVSDFEQATENTKFNGNGAAKDAHSRKVSTFDAFADDSEVLL
ncbi:MAG TPA: AAA family ATPase [Candidatus Acidoferrum sp.]|nr:AAA family ATPase [Candidatus Acidoferrum sp.]